MFGMRRHKVWSHWRRGSIRHRRRVPGMPCLRSRRNRKTKHSVFGVDKYWSLLAPRLEPAQVMRAWDGLIATLEKSEETMPAYWV